jgi:hypothetical protein
MRAIERYRTMRDIDDPEVADRRGGALRILASFGLAGVTDEVLQRAADPFPVYVATLDAIHLATAILIREAHADLHFATHDRTLALAAKAVGFQVIGD